MAQGNYSVGVTRNRFQLFDDEEEDPIEILKKTEQEIEEKKKIKLCEKENKGKGPVKNITGTAMRKGIQEVQNNKPDQIKSIKPEAPLKGKVPNKETLNKFGDRKINGEVRDREERINRRNREEGGGEAREERRFERREGGGTRGGREGGGFGGRRGGRGGFDSRGKREYDRQSGSDKTGIKSVDKRDGGGAHNWGNHQDDLAVLDSEKPDDSWEEKTDETAPATTETGTEDTTTPAEVPETTDAPITTPAPEEPREMTLDEWKALQAQSRASKPDFKVRKAGEGEDLTQWKKMYALDKKKNETSDANVPDDDEEYETCEYPQRVGRQKHILDIDFTFKDERRGAARGGRGGGSSARGVSGGGRGGRGGRGGERRGGGSNINPTEREHLPRNTGKEAPKVDDESAFPSLG